MSSQCSSSITLSERRSPSEAVGIVVRRKSLPGLSSNTFRLCFEGRASNGGDDLQAVILLGVQARLLQVFGSFLLGTLS